MNPHCTTGRDPRQKPRRLFPSRTVAPLRLLSRLFGLHNPTMEEFESMEMDIALVLLSIAQKLVSVLGVM